MYENPCSQHHFYIYKHLLDWRFFTESHKSGDLIHLDDEDKLDYLSNYNGLGYLCREEDDGTIHVSTIVPDMDYELPKIYTNYFTHILWYNR